MGEIAYLMDLHGALGAFEEAYRIQNPLAKLRDVPGALPGVLRLGDYSNVSPEEVLPLRLEDFYPKDKIPELVAFIAGYSGLKLVIQVKHSQRKKVPRIGLEGIAKDEERFIQEGLDSLFQANQLGYVSTIVRETPTKKLERLQLANQKGLQAGQLARCQ